MTDAIYGARVPADAKGKKFWYKVDSYDEERDSFTLIYQKKAIDPEAEGAIFYAFAEDTDNVFLENMDISSVKEAQSLWWSVTTKTKRAEADKKDSVKKQLMMENKDPSVMYDFTDIQKIVDSDEKGGMSYAIIELEFEQLENNEETDKKQRWKHKPTGKEFFRYKSKNGRTWDTGVWTKQLKILVDGKTNKKGMLHVVTYM